MRRKIKDFISPKALFHLFYIPVIIFKIKNWLSFILNYAGLKDSVELYTFRNGIKIKTGGGVDAATVMVVFIKRHYGDIGDNNVVVDIGANIGVYSLYAAMMAKNTFVYAYEPEERNFNLLLENIGLNYCKNIQPFKMGVAGKGGKRKLYLSDSPFHSLYQKEEKQKYYEIDCVSVKDIFDDNKMSLCDVLKVDCEGAEFEIMYGIPEEYLSRIKKIYLEFHSTGIKELLSFLGKKGFKVTNIKKESEIMGNVWLENINLAKS